MAIALFYVIAVIVRALALKYQDLDTHTYVTWLWNWARGIGPCFVLLPFCLCFFLNRELSYTLLGFVFYSFLEEVGWRGYLQGELKELNTIWRVLIIGLMWFFWHISIGFNMGSLIFLAVLLLGTCGIGCIARDTKSLVACACFHTLFNFSNQSGITFTPMVIVLYFVVIAGWFVIWYVPWNKIVVQKKDKG